MVRAAHLLRHLVAVTTTAKAIGKRGMVRSCCDIQISIASKAIVYRIAIVYLCSAYDGITASAYCLSPNCSRLAALQNHSHLSAGELCCCLAFSPTSSICSVYASNRTFIFVVIAFGNCTRIFSTHATRITFIGIFQIADVIAVGDISAVIISTYSTDLRLPVIYCSYVIAIGDGGICEVHSTHAADIISLSI